MGKIELLKEVYILILWWAETDTMWGRNRIGLKTSQANGLNPQDERDGPC